MGFAMLLQGTTTSRPVLARYRDLSAKGPQVSNSGATLDLNQLAANLGNPKFHLVERPPISLVEAVFNMITDLSGNLVPRQTCHVLIKRLYYSTEYLEWLDSKPSARLHRLSQDSATHGPPNFSLNLVEVLFIDINGEDVEVEEKDTFLLCATLSQWIHKTGSKGSRKVFSCLKRPPILGTNNYSRGAFLFE